MTRLNALKTVREPFVIISVSCYGNCTKVTWELRVFSSRCRNIFGTLQKRSNYRPEMTGGISRQNNEIHGKRTIFLSPHKVLMNENEHDTKTRYKDLIASLINIWFLPQVPAVDRQLAEISRLTQETTNMYFTSLRTASPFSSWQ